MDVRIKGSGLHRGAISVDFATDNDDEFYYTHSTHELGTPEDEPGKFTAWGWVNHMRSKRWWNDALEEQFLEEVKKHL